MNNNLLKAKIVENGMTQRSLAALIGISKKQSVPQDIR